MTSRIHAPRMLSTCALVFQISLPGSIALAVTETTTPSYVDANNPLAECQAFNRHNYYVSSLTETDNQTANTFWARYAQPFGKWLFRGSLPIQRVPTGVAQTTYSKRGRNRCGQVARWRGGDLFCNTDRYFRRAVWR